jgi:PIN domain nuclease of toxin-antitoxin system
VQYLLDTHVVLHLLSEPNKVPERVRRALEESEAFVSAASLWEISIKVALGKLKVPPDFFERLEELEFDELAITGDHARAVMTLEPIHNDPFDRMLIAQARCEKLVLVTGDGLMAKYSGIEVYW